MKPRTNRLLQPLTVDLATVMLGLTVEGERVLADHGRAGDLGWCSLCDMSSRRRVMK